MPTSSGSRSTGLSARTPSDGAWLRPTPVTIVIYSPFSCARPGGKNPPRPDREDGRPRTGDACSHVSCASTTYCVAVGYRFNPMSVSGDHTLAEAWDGTTWTIQPTVNP
jgi:hypothetical protein